eukprot:m.73236 g.73236  ORF g.73236 m.73236 type:complete len:105 (+) comp13883_c1_seq1:90-404(+)
MRIAFTSVFISRIVPAIRSYASLLLLLVCLFARFFCFVFSSFLILFGLVVGLCVCGNSSSSSSPPSLSVGGCQPLWSWSQKGQYNVPAGVFFSLSLSLVQNMPG